MLRRALNLIFLFGVNAATTHSFNDGPCHIIPPPDNYNVSKFTESKWYKLYHSYNDELHFFDNLKCIEKYVSYDAHVGSLVFDTYGVSTITSKPIWIKSYGYTTAQPGVFKFLIANASVPYDTLEHRLVDTDYKTYTVSYTCGYSQKTNKHFITAGISSNTNHLASPEKLLNTVKLFRMYNLNLDFVPVDWSDCRARCVVH